MFSRCVLMTALVSLASSSLYSPLKSQIDPEPVIGHAESAKFESNLAGRADDVWRLPSDLYPISYSVELLPFFEDRDFRTEGLVEMFIQCVSTTPNITFNSAGITIDTGSITVRRRDNNELVEIDTTIEEANYQKFTIRTKTDLTAGSQYIVTIEFSYALSIPLNGFFRTSYVENGVTKWMAATQFEAPNARKAFPCFDEPAFKAIFFITLGRKESWTALSNTPVEHTVPIDTEPGYVWDIFEPTVKMPTYLVAFVVSELARLDSPPGLSNVQFTIWARSDVISQGEYAADVGPRISEYFEQWYEIDFPLPKQDMAAVPRYGGAMENWGLIIYGESNLLYNPDVNTAAYKYGLAEVIAHELAHQWTGNWVTCKWWNVIWLNEGYAQLMQYYGTDGAEPQYGAFEILPVRTFQPTLITDSVPTRPINRPVSSPAESSAMFDSITYSKGACIIRMMADFLGAETFRKGMNLYLTRMAYGSAEQDDLFGALNDRAVTDGVNLPVTVKEIMDTWTFQMGYPLVTVTRDYATGLATAIQQRFLRVASDDTTEFKWWVPLSYCTAADPERSAVWLSEIETNGIEFGAAADQWVLVNVDQMGYYRVKYDPTNYGLIRDQLVADHTQISVNNRAQLLDDAFNLALLGSISYTDAFDMTLYMSKEQSYSPWHGVLPELDYINSMFLNGPLYGNWKRYMTSLVAPYYDFIGFEENPGDAHLTILSRSNSINWACRLAIDDCVQMSQVYYSAWTIHPADIEVISRNQKSTILCAGIENGNETDWEYGYNRFLNPQDPSERGTILNALGCTKITWLQSRMLELMLNRPAGVSVGDGVSFFTAVANNPTGNRLAFDFLRNNWDALMVEYSGFMADLFRTVSTRYNTQLQLNTMVSLIELHNDVLGGSAAAQQAINTVQSNIDWMNANSQIISNWLSQHL